MTQNSEFSVPETIGGGRNGFTPLYVWSKLSLNDYHQEIAEIKSCLDKAKYLHQQLQAIDDELGEFKIEPSRAPYSVCVTFTAPSNEILDKYCLPVKGQRSHIFLMKHVTRAVIDELISDFREYCIKQKSNKME